MHNTKPSSSTKKLVKLIISCTFFEFGKARKVKEFLLKMDNYYDIQKPNEDNKVSLAMTFLKNHVL